MRASGKERQTDRRTYRQIDRQTDKLTDKQTDRDSQVVSLSINRAFSLTEYKLASFFNANTR